VRVHLFGLPRVELALKEERGDLADEGVQLARLEQLRGRRVQAPALTNDGHDLEVRAPRGAGNRARPLELGNLAIALRNVRGAQGLVVDLRGRAHVRDKRGVRHTHPQRPLMAQRTFAFLHLRATRIHGRSQSRTIARLAENDFCGFDHPDAQGRDGGQC
jgi:hypothetical protein